MYGYSGVGTNSESTSNAQDVVERDRLKKVSASNIVSEGKPERS
jgi:hypothetical protein